MIGTGGMFEPMKSMIVAGGSTSTLVLAGSTEEDRLPTGAPSARTASIAAARSRR